MNKVSTVATDLGNFFSHSTHQLVVLQQITSMRSSSPGMQWSFGSSKVSAMPHVLSFKEDESSKRSTVHRHHHHDPITPLDSNYKPYTSALLQKNMYLDKHYNVVRSYATQQRFDPYPVSSSTTQHEQTISVSSMTGPVLQPHFASTSINSQPHLGGRVSGTCSPVIGTTDLRDQGPKPSQGSAQLTIFYAGSVCVYDDVSPEKAHAIMLLAGNGSSASTQNKTQSRSTAQAVQARPTSVTGDSNYTAALNPTPISVRISTNDQLATVKPMTSSLISANYKTDPASMAIVSSAEAVPQARKASLQRFLEKRKERLTSTWPYEANKK